MFIRVPRKLDDFCTETNKTNENLGEISFLQIMEMIFIAFPPR